jgi:FKBP-type peptidyl-prolyl cis-trans isomerase SlpA
MSECIQANSLVTLHYQLAADDDTVLVSTFASTPATLQLGNGELAPPLEACLVGLPTGARQVFLLAAEQAFGPRNPQLVQRLARADLPQDKLEPLAVIEFSGPHGASITGVVRALDDTSALIDFNHPLAGRSVRFTVEIVGILS